MKIPDPLPVERISMGSIMSSLLSSLNLEKGYLFTLKQLLLHPGKAVRGYLFTEERPRYVKPLTFLLFNLAISIFITFKILHWSGQLDLNTLNTGNTKLTPEMHAALSKLLEVIFKYQNLFEVLKVPFISLLTYKLFENARLNFAEHLVMNAYALSVQSLLTILILMLSLVVSPTLILAAIPLVFLYYIFIHVKVFEERPLWQAILKSFAAWTGAYLIHGFILIGILYCYFSWIEPDPNVRILIAPFLK